MSLDKLLWDAVESDSQETNASDRLKFLFVGGKGGVGKTTCSSSIATLLATHCQKRILLVSTDPAHSLSDAFQRDFSSEPTMALPNLHVMEVNPQDSLKQEIEKWSEVFGELAGEAMTEGFPEWLSGIPGIDEAMALSKAMHWIESGDFDIVCFDTAPTGHTLKLLQLPTILQQGIERLQSWQGKIWGVWEMLKGAHKSSSNSIGAKRAQATEWLQSYKSQIQKVATILQNQRQTQFIVVCIAEYLSVSETRRLLRELKTHRVRASHIVVNQLVTNDALTPQEVEALETSLAASPLTKPKLIEKAVKANRLVSARKSIQEKYLSVLKSSPEAEELLATICELPLLAEEVTGVEALKRFGGLMIHNPPVVYQQRHKVGAKASREAEMEPADQKRSKTEVDDNTQGPFDGKKITKGMAILEDPEIQQMIKGNPRYQEVVNDLLQNPMRAMQYILDPELTPLIQKAMSKL